MPKDKQLQMYLGLCTEFYDIDKAVVPEKEWLFYLDYVNATKGLILEPMCGSGRFLLPLIEMGFLVDGFDASESMLDALLRKSSSRNLRPKVWKAFLQDLEVPERYELIFIPDASFNLVLNIDEIKLCLAKIYEHLCEGGRFVFELVTLQYRERIEVGATNRLIVKRDDDKLIIQNIEVLPFEGQSGRTRSRFDLVEKDEILKSETEDFSFFFHNADEMELWLEEVGFTHIKRLKAFDRNQEASEDDAVIVFECAK